jgi:holliday junction DNA helicase RuvA
MIAFLRGRLLEKQPNRVVVDVCGVGYEVHVPLSTYYVVGEAGAEAALRVHTHVREDALTLFGFATAREQNAFEKLIGISGIGPRLAIGVLSGIDARDLERAVHLGDVARLTAVPGIGKRTAERIVLELREKLQPAEGEAAESVPVGQLRQDLLSALLNLGYHRTFAEKAVEAALESGGEPTFDAKLRRALQQLAR